VYRVLEALEQLPLRTDTPLPVPGQVGQLPDLHDWRRGEWKPALRAAGLAYRTPTLCDKPSSASASRPGIATFEIARVAGTSVLQIEPTYGHLLPPRLSGRGALDCLRRSNASFEQQMASED